MSSFLNDFIKMRANLRTGNAGTPTVIGMPAPTSKGKKATVEVSKPTGSSITLAYIIEQEPPVPEVIEYFKNKIALLEGEEED